MSGTLLNLSTVTLQYGNDPAVVNGVDAAADGGALICMIGANGSGKSTLLRAAAGLHRPVGGSVSVDGAPLYGAGALDATERARLVAVVLTDEVQTGFLTVEQVVHLGRTPYAGRRNDPDNRRAVDRAMGQTGITDLRHRVVSTLSDGQRRRVMIARALAQEPRLLLLDEPGSYLDPPHQVDLFARLRSLTREHPTTAIVVATHSIELALRFGDVIWLVSDGSVTAGAPEEIARPATMEAAFPHDGTRFDATTLRFVPRSHPVT